MYRDKTEQSGSAIVAVLLVVAVISIVATALMMQQRIDIRRTQQIQTAHQAYRYSQAVLYWATGTILNAANQPSTEEESVWVRDFPGITVENPKVNISGRLERLDNRVNINAFLDTSSAIVQKDLIQFITGNTTEVSENELSDIFNNITQWISPTVTKSDDYYLQLSPPYRAAHIPMVSPSEIRLVVGVDAKTYQVLEPYVITLPTRSAKNVGHYLLTTEVELNDQRLKVYSILYTQSTSVVRLLWSTLGTW